MTHRTMVLGEISLEVNAEETMSFTPPRVSRQSKGSKFMFSNPEIQNYDIAVERQSLSVINFDQHFRSMSRTSFPLRSSKNDLGELILEDNRSMEE